MSSNGQDRVRVLQVRARNIKKIREVAITFEGEVHEIRGDTGQGKTTILESIEAGLRGLEPSMVRNGESKAEIELTLSEAIIKRITPRDGKETVMVTDSNGNPIEKAKEFLAALCGPSAFRPLDWVQLGGGPQRGKTERLRQQRDQLLEAIPLSLSYEQVIASVEALGEDHQDALEQISLDDVNFSQHAFIVCSTLERLAYDFRQYQNKAVKDAENKLKVTPAPDKAAPKAPASELEHQLQELTERYWTAKGKQDNFGQLKQQRDALAKRIEQDAGQLPDLNEVDKYATHYREEAREARDEIARLEELLAKQKERLSEAQKGAEQCESMRRQIENHEARKADLAHMDAELAGEGETEDMEALTEQIEAVNAKLEARQAQDAHDTVAAQYRDAQAKSDLFTELVTLFRDELPKALLESSDLPVEGLGIEGDCVTIQGVPLHQLGTSEQIRVGVLIAAALNPRSGFVLVDGAESLGKNDRAALAQAAHELSLQLLMTYVDESAQPGPGVTVMQEGEAQ